MASKKKPQKKAAKAKAFKPKNPAKRTRLRSSESGDNGSDGQQLVLSFPGTLLPMGLSFVPSLEYDEWAPVGIKLRRAKEWLQFAIGDWLNHGEAHYGETYSQAATETGLPEETLMILKSIASRVEPERRIKDLTWSHHREVAKFPPEEQTKWLEKALSKQWSVRDLKDALKKAAGKGGGKEEGEDKEDREEGPPTGEGCACCGSSPASLRLCSKCLAVPVKALETVGIKGAIELLNRKPSKPQLSMLKWAFAWIEQPEKFESEQAEAEWEARYEALGKVAAKVG